MTIRDGRLSDFTAGHITSEEGQVLIEALQARLGRPEIEFVAGVSYRNLMIYRGRGRPAPFADDTRTTSLPTTTPTGRPRTTSPEARAPNSSAS